MVRMLLRPGWILTHLVVLGIAVLFVNLGLWQLDRHAERQDEEAHLASLQDLPAVPLDALLSQDDPHLRLAEVTGRFLPEDEVRLSPRSRNELPGFEVLTPMALPDGRTLIVDRGWIPLDQDPPPPPEGEVSLVVRLREPASARQVLTGDGGRVQLVSNVDMDVLAPLLDQPITAAWGEVVDEEARLAGVIPRPAEPARPESSGNNLSYAMQWFAFAIIGLVGYPLLLRRRMSDRRRAVASPSDAADSPRGDHAQMSPLP